MRGCAAVPASELNENLLIFDIIRVKSKTQRVYAGSAELCGSDKNMSRPVHFHEY